MIRISKNALTNIINDSSSVILCQSEDTNSKVLDFNQIDNALGLPQKPGLIIANDGNLRDKYKYEIGTDSWQDFFSKYSLMISGYWDSSHPDVLCWYNWAFLNDMEGQEGVQESWNR